MAQNNRKANELKTPNELLMVMSRKDNLSNDAYLFIKKDILGVNHGRYSGD